MKNPIILLDEFEKNHRGIKASDIVDKDFSFDFPNFNWPKKILWTACWCRTEPDFTRSRILDDKGNVLLEEENIESRYKRWKKQRAEYRVKAIKHLTTLILKLKKRNR